MKCSRENCHILPCESLQKAIEYGNPTGAKKGVFFWRLYDVKSGENTRTFVGIKSGDFKKNGVALNFCPFCGENIEP